MPDHLEHRLDLRFDAPPPPADLARRARTTARRRRSRHLAASGTALVAGVVAVVTVALVLPGSGRDDELASPGATTSAPTHTATPTPTATRTPWTPPAGTTAPGGSVAAGPVPVPGRFIAFTPAGAERPTLVDTATGRTLRVLGPPAQVGGVLTPDRATLYLPATTDQVSGLGCDERWQAVSVATGASRPVPGLTGLSGFAVSPAGDAVAAVTGADGCSAPGETDPGAELRVLRLDGTLLRRAALPAGNWFVDAWSPAGGTLLLDERGTTTTYRVYDAAGLTPRGALPAPAAGCVTGSGTLRGDSDVVVAQTCTAARRTSVDLVDVDLATGRETRRVLVASGTSAAGLGPVYNGISLDPSGQHALLALNRSGSRDGEVYVVTGGTATRQGLTGVYGQLW